LIQRLRCARSASSRGAKHNQTFWQRCESRLKATARCWCSFATIWPPLINQQSGGTRQQSASRREGREGETRIATAYSVSLSSVIKLHKSGAFHCSPDVSQIQSGMLNTLRWRDCRVTGGYVRATAGYGGRMFQMQ